MSRSLVTSIMDRIAAVRSPEYFSSTPHWCGVLKTAAAEPAQRRDGIPRGQGHQGAWPRYGRKMTFPLVVEVERVSAGGCVAALNDSSALPLLRQEHAGAQALSWIGRG